MEIFLWDALSKTLLVWTAIPVLAGFITAVVFKKQGLSQILAIFAAVLLVLSFVCMAISPHYKFAYHGTRGWIVCNDDWWNGGIKIVSDKAVTTVDAPDHKTGIWKYRGGYYFNHGKPVGIDKDRRVRVPVLDYASSNEVGQTVVVVNSFKDKKLWIVYTICPLPKLGPSDKLYWEYHKSYPTASPHDPAEGRFVVIKG